MTSATNRTDRLAKALKECRPDFTLHNARVFARAVIEAPDGVFSEKPLTFLPKGHRVPATGLPEVSAAGGSQVDGGFAQDPHSVILGRGGWFDTNLGAATGGGPGPDTGRRDTLSTDGSPAVSYSALPPSSAWDSLPGMIERPTMPSQRSREQAVESWDAMLFALGVDGSGTEVSWSPARSGCLAVIGDTGSGKTVVIDALLEDATASGWTTLHADLSQGGPVDRSDDAVHGRDGVGGYDEVIDTVRRIVMDRQDGRMLLGHNKTLESGPSFTVDLPSDAPVLVVLDGIDVHYRSQRGDLERGLLRQSVAEILSVGRELRIHVVLGAQAASTEDFPTQWANMLAAVLLAGRPSGATRRLVGVVDGFPEVQWRSPGSMTRMTLVDRHAGGSRFTPLQPYAPSRR